MVQLSGNSLIRLPGKRRSTRHHGTAIREQAHQIAGKAAKHPSSWYSFPGTASLDCREGERSAAQRRARSARHHGTAIRKQPHQIAGKAAKHPSSWYSYQGTSSSDCRESGEAPVIMVQLSGNSLTRLPGRRAKRSPETCTKRPSSWYSYQETASSDCRESGEAPVIMVQLSGNKLIRLPGKRRSTRHHGTAIREQPHQ